MNTTLDNQHAWICDQTFLDPEWARSEFDLRRQAVGIQESFSCQVHRQEVRLVLHKPITASRLSPLASMPTATFNEIHFPVLRVGGKEELLLIEECLRRAYAGMGW